MCLVVEGLSDIGNVSAAFRSADMLGVHSVHAISCDGNKRYRDNRPVSLGAEKWLDIKLWNSPAECFHALKKNMVIAFQLLVWELIQFLCLAWTGLIRLLLFWARSIWVLAMTL